MSGFARSYAIASLCPPTRVESKPRRVRGPATAHRTAAPRRSIQRRGCRIAPHLLESRLLGADGPPAVLPVGQWRSGSALPWHGRGQGFDSPLLHPADEWLARLPSGHFFFWRLGLAAGRRGARGPRGLTRARRREWRNRTPRRASSGSGKSAGPRRACIAPTCTLPTGPSSTPW